LITCVAETRYRGVDAELAAREAFAIVLTSLPDSDT
jgi:hypothetical protein